MPHTNWTTNDLFLPVILLHLVIILHNTVIWQLLKGFLWFHPFFWHRFVVQVSVPPRSSGEPPCRWCVPTGGLLWKYDHWQHVLCWSSWLEPGRLWGIPDKPRLDTFWIFLQQIGLLIYDLMCLSLPGRLRRAAGVWDWPQALPVWGNQLGRRLRKGVSARGLHQVDQLQPVDRGENGAVVNHSWLHVSSELNDQTRTWANCAVCCFYQGPRLEIFCFLTL